MNERSAPRSPSDSADVAGSAESAADRSHAEIVITGIGLSCSLGNGLEACWAAAQAGRDGFRSLDAMGCDDAASRTGGQAPPLGHEPFDRRESEYLDAALDEALAMAGVAGASGVAGAGGAAGATGAASAAGAAGAASAAGAAGAADIASTGDIPADRRALVLGTTLAGMRRASKYFRGGGNAPMRSFLAGDVAIEVARRAGIHGLTTSVSAACASGLSSVIHAASLLRAGAADLVVCGGYDPVSEYAYGGFNALRLIDGTPTRPFAAERAGMTIGEGYGIFVVERAADARRRGARILARVAGCGESTDGHHLTQPHPDGQGLRRAIDDALADAAAGPTDIGLISLHGTGTPANDAAEHAALRHAFGAQLAEIPAVAFKAGCGHTLGGAGAVELALSWCAMRDGIAPPTARAEPDREAFPDLRITPEASAAPGIRATLGSSLGFGGANAAVVLRPGDAGAAPGGDAGADGGANAGAATSAAPATPATRNGSAPASISEPSASAPSPATGATVLTAARPLAVRGMGFFGCGLEDVASFVARCTSATDLGDAIPPGWREDRDVDFSSLEAIAGGRRLRRMSTYAKLVLAASRQAMDDAAADDDPPGTALLASTHGACAYTEQYYEQLVADGVEGANPLWFAEGVPNVGSAHVGMAFGVRGTAQTIIGSRSAGLDAVLLAMSRASTSGWSRVLVGAAEEQSDRTSTLYGAFGMHATSAGGRASARPASASAAVSDPGGAGAPPLTTIDQGAAERPALGRGGFFSGFGAASMVLDACDPGDAHPAGTAIIDRAAGTTVTAPSLDAYADAVDAVLAGLGDPPAVMLSACGTWLDLAELRGLQRMTRRTGQSVVAGTLHGLFPELFAVGPVASLLAVAQLGGIPAACVGRDRRRITMARSVTPADAVAILATGHDGSVRGVRVTWARG